MLIIKFTEGLLALFKQHCVPAIPVIFISLCGDMVVLYKDAFTVPITM